MTVETLVAPPTQTDSAWKDIVNLWFPEFMTFFYPHLAKEIDWSAGYESLDKELQAITSQSMLGNRLVDKLMKVKLRQGNELWILLHIEIQGQKETAFEKRLFEYYYRLHDRYNIPIVTLAILADNHLNWRPFAYEVNILGLEVLSFRFSSVKLLDYRDKQEFLEQTTNPFGIIIQAQLAALKTQKDIDTRLTVKFGLTRKLYERGLNRDAILNLYKFIDWVLTLPKDLAIRYTVAYITTAERIGLEKGYAQGIQQGEKLLLIKQLKHRFTTLSAAHAARIEKADMDTLSEWSEKILEAKKIEDVFGE